MDKITDASQDFSIPDTVYLAQSDKGNTTSILNGNDLYTLRPKEYDYYSRLNDEKREAYLLQQRIEKEKQVLQMITKMRGFVDTLLIIQLLYGQGVIPRKQ